MHVVGHCELATTLFSSALTNYLFNLIDYFVHGMPDLNFEIF